MADEIASLKVVIESEDRASAVINGIGSSMSGIGRATTPAVRAADTVAASWQNTGKRIQNVGEGIDTVTKPVQAAAVAVTGLGVASGKAAINFEDNFAAVKKTVDGTPEQLKEVEKSLISLTTKGLEGRKPVRATTAELTELASVAGQLGYKADEVAGFAEVMAQMQSATNLGGEEGAKTLARYMNVTQTAHDKTRNLGSAIVYLGNNYETTEAEIASMAMRLGRTGTLVGMSAADTLGFATALSSMGIEAEAGGTAVSKSWTKIDNAVAKGGDNLEAFAKVSGKSAKDFAAKWKTDAAGAFIDFLGGLEKAENLPLLLQDLGITEVRESDALKALALGYDKAKNAVSDANKAWEENTALQKEADAMADTTAGKLATAKNNIVEAGRSIGAAFLPAIADAAQGVSGVAQKFADMSDEGKHSVIGTGAAVVGLGLVSKAASGAIKWVGKTTEAVGKFSEVVGIAPKSIGVAGLAIAGLAVAIPTVVKWYKEAKEAQLDWSDGLYESAEAVTEHYDRVKKLGELSSEVEDLKLVINSDDSSAEEIEAAKARLSEIADMLNKEYELHIGSDTSQIDETLKKLSEAELSAARLSASTLNQDLASKKEDYFSNPQKIREYTQEMESARDKATRYGDALSDAQNALSDFHSFENDYAAEHGESLFSDNPQLYAEKWQETIDKVNGAIADTDLTPLTPDDNASLTIDQLDEDFNSANDRAKELEDSIGKLNDSQKEFESARNDYISAGLSEIMSGDEDVGFNYITRAVQDYGAAVVEAGAKAAVAKTGFSNLNQAIENGKLDEVVNNYTSYARELGASNTQIAQGAALIKNGFTDMQSAINAGALPAVQADMNELAHSMDLLPDSKHIEISAEGDISVIDDATGKIEQIQGENVTVSVNADGDVSIVDETAGKVQTLSGLGEVHIGVNAEGDIAILDQANQEIATINENGEITVNGEYPGADEIQQALNDKDNVSDKDASLTVNGQYNGGADVAQAISDGQALQSIGDQTVTYTVNYVQNGTPPKQQATGTNYFSGGLAMVNDQRGVADPRELVVDHGRAFIPEGQNVILPLSKGAKVYTASQTKAIMAGLGIPQYAKGKENSDAFTKAKENWTHYTKTHAVTTAEELEKWVELSKKFVKNEKDAADIAEEIYSLQRKINDEMNERSAAWIDDRAALNDWEDYGDTAIAAFDRVRARNREEFEAGRLTWEEYTDIISNLGSDMYDARIEQSKNWLDHEEKYRGMSEDDYIAGLDRMAAYTREYYDNGLISYREYTEGLAEIDDERTDKWKDKLDRQMDESLAWIDDRTYFNDWQNFNDDPISAYERIHERNAAALNEGKLTWEEYTDMMSEAGSALYDGRLDNSRAWLEEQKKYFGMETDDYIAGLNRMKAYTQEYYDKGIITYREYAEGMRDINHDIWDAAAEAYDDMLDKQSEYIREMEKKFSDQESDLRASWEVEDRAVDMADLEHQLAIFEGAVTDRGQEHYKDLLEQYKNAQREEELYNLQVRNNAVIEDLQAEYAVLENAKAGYIKGIAENTDIDVGGYVREITTNISQSNNSTLSTLRDIITAIKNLDFKMEQQNFSDNRTITVYASDNVDLQPMFAGFEG